jgi:hypothetical protein
MIRTIIATCLGVLLAVAVLIGVWAALRWSSPGTVNIPQTTEIQPTYAERMVQLGYWHDHATDRWYSAMLIYADHCRLIAGTQADATLQCQTPLNPRFGLPNKDETP